MMPFLAVYPNLMVILTISLGFIRGSRSGWRTAWWRDFFSICPPAGLWFLYVDLHLAGYLNGICTRYYYEDYITLPLVLSALNELIYNFYLYVFGFLVRGRLDHGYYFLNIILPETIFTVVTTLIVYRLFLFISRKLEALEKGETRRLFKRLAGNYKEFLKKLISSRLFILGGFLFSFFAFWESVC